ncbi:PI31 proteasome regulator N-terminal-domain-containing protein [Geopyxis carbonaria]|nr:PI31 proteasome regulator N-terminal-domain-containing protein [Geopyxis carbonaria]
MSNIPFSPDNIIRIVTASLLHEAEAQPQLKNSTDAIAIFTHACMLSVGFRLLGLSEDERLESPIDESNPKPLPAGWNAANGSHSFHYAHSQSSLTYLIRINRLGGKTVVMGLGIGDDKTTTFDLTTKDYMSESFFPYTLPSSADITSTKLQDGFISESRMRDLAALIKINIVQKLMPNLVKDGYEEERTRDGGQQSSRSQQQPHNRPDEDPLRVPRPYGGGFGGGPRAPPIPTGGERPPGFDDEYEVMQPARGGYGAMPGRHPLSIGEDDLNPPGLGPNPPLRGPFFGEGGIGGMGGMGPMGGMHPGPDHPMFGGMGAGGVGPGARAPPGARYDPIGPGDQQPMGGLRGPRGPGGPGGAPHNPFSGFGSGDFM